MAMTVLLLEAGQSQVQYTLQSLTSHTSPPPPLTHTHTHTLDPGRDHTLTFEEREVVVPQGQPVAQSKFSQSYFSQSEYLVYRESQNCIRYLLKMKMF